MTRETEHITACRSCGAAIIFLRGVKIDDVTGKRKLVPVNAETVDRDDYDFDAKKHKAHFATCPDADQFRKKR